MVKAKQKAPVPGDLPVTYRWLYRALHGHSSAQKALLKAAQNFDPNIVQNPDYWIKFHGEHSNVNPKKSEPQPPKLMGDAIKAAKPKQLVNQPISKFAAPRLNAFTNIGVGLTGWNHAAIKAALDASNEPKEPDMPPPEKVARRDEPQAAAAANNDHGYAQQPDAARPYANQNQNDDDVEMPQGDVATRTGYMASAHTNELGLLDANFQKPAKSNLEKSQTKIFSQAFEHVISNNPETPIFPDPPTEEPQFGKTHKTPFHKVPYYMIRSSMRGEDVLWLEQHAFAAKLNRVWFKVEGVKSTETKIEGSQNNPRLRLKDAPVTKVQMSWRTYGYGGANELPRGAGQANLIDHAYKNNQAMTNPIPKKHFTTGQTGSELNNAVLPRYTYPHTLRYNKMLTRRVMLYDVNNQYSAAVSKAYGKNPRVETEFTSFEHHMFDTATAEDKDKTWHPWYNPEESQFTTRNVDELYGVEHGVNTNHKTFMFVNKVVPPELETPLSYYYYDTVNQANLVWRYPLVCTNNAVAVAADKDKVSKDKSDWPVINDTQTEEQKLKTAAKQRMFLTPKNDFKFLCSVKDNISWDPQISRWGQTFESEAPNQYGQWPEFLIRLNPEDDEQGDVIRWAEVRIRYYCEIEYIPLVFPPTIAHPKTLMPRVCYQAFIDGTDADHANEIPTKWLLAAQMYAPVLGSNAPLWPFGVRFFKPATTFGTRNAIGYSYPLLREAPAVSGGDPTSDNMWDNIHIKKRMFIGYAAQELGQEFSDSHGWYFNYPKYFDAAPAPNGDPLKPKPKPKPKDKSIVRPSQLDLSQFGKN